MGSLPYLQKQNLNENMGRYKTKELSAVLSEMQKRPPNLCKTTEDHSYQRARRTDAEPITRRLTCGYRFFLFDDCLQSRRFLFEKLGYGGGLKPTFFKDTAVSWRYRHVLSIYANPPNTVRSKSHYPPAGYSGYEYELSNYMECNKN